MRGRSLNNTKRNWFPETAISLLESSPGRLNKIEVWDYIRMASSPDGHF